jgi:hypothetical protein
LSAVADASGTEASAAEPQAAQVPRANANRQAASLPAAQRSTVRLTGSRNAAALTAAENNVPLDDPAEDALPAEAVVSIPAESLEAPEATRDPAEVDEASWTPQAEPERPARDSAGAIRVRPAGGQWKPARTLQAADPPQSLPRHVPEPDELAPVHPAHWESPVLPAPAAPIESAEEVRSEAANADGDALDEDSASTVRIVGIRDADE